MKKVEMSYHIEGTSALRPACSDLTRKEATIIPFPGESERLDSAARRKAMGSLQGLAFNQFTKAQAGLTFCAGVIMSVLALLL